MENLRSRSLKQEKLEQEALKETQEETKEEPNSELWTEEDKLIQIPVGHRYRNEQRKVLHRSTTEAVIGLWVHLIFLVYYIAVHVYDSTFFKRCEEKDKFFPGHNTFGGRFKFLTHIIMWCMLVYFFLAFFTDIMPQSLAKLWFHKVTDWFFTSVIWSAAWIMVIMYWVLYAANPKNFYSFDYNVCIPPLMNHVLHTFPVPVVLIELLLVFHRYPSNLVAAFSAFTICSGYFVWVLAVFSKLNKWPYPFMVHLNPFTFIIFIASCTVFFGLLYIVGKIISSFMWRKRMSILQEMDEDN